MNVCNKSKAYIIGIGSSFGDDQAGWLVIDLLRQKIKLKNIPTDTIYLTTYQRPDLSILTALQEAACVYLIDAVITGKAPIGTLWELKQEEIFNMNGLISTHGINIAEILAMGKILYELPEKIYYYGIEIKEINKFSEVSPPVLQAVERLTDKLIIQINAMLTNNYA